MASTNPNACLVSCPGCGAHYDFPASLAGQRGRCAQCGEAFTVPAPATHEPDPRSEWPQYIGVDCRLCGTRMYGGPDDVGHELKCPDCGVRTVLPPPPKPKPKNIPAALEGEQYELWDADTQPLPRELVAHQPKFIAVRCRKCDTLMYASENQVGQSISCPDCGRKHVVPPPIATTAAPSPLASDAETPLLDPAAAPGERPSAMPQLIPLMACEEEQEAAYARALEKSKRTGKPMEIDSRGRPVLPRWPLLSGILAFPFYPGCPQRWAALALGLVLVAGLLLDGVPAWLYWQGDALGAMGAMGGLVETLIGAVAGIIWLAAASNIFLAIVSQSAAGSDRISEWPPMGFIMSMGEMLPVSVAIVFTAAPGWMLGRLLADDPSQLMLLTGGTLLLGFPVTLLSQLAGSYTWELIDLKVLGAMVRCPLSMALFYFQSACLAALCLSASIAVAQYHEFLVVALAPLYVGCLLVYARLLGRLAWRLSDVMAADEA